MSHNHNHSHHEHDHKDVSNIKVAFFLNLSFSIIEIVGGILTNSVAILSDAVHDLGDSLSLGLAWVFQKVARKGRTQAFSYGYKRFSLLGAIINSLVLIAGSTIILFQAIPRIFSPEETNTGGMFILAIVGIVINGAAVLRLKKGSSLNEKVVSLHLLEDVLGWIAILIGSVVMHFWDVPILDPILSIAIACFILLNIYRNIRQALRIILQGIPPEIDLSNITRTIELLPEVNNVHDLHVWSMDGEYNILTMHVAVDKNKDLDELVVLKQKIRSLLQEQNIQHTTIEFESVGEKCRYEQDMHE